jgi:Eukaryotic protein of unknown function (DUF829)
MSFQTRASAAQERAHELGFRATFHARHLSSDAKASSTATATVTGPEHAVLVIVFGWFGGAHRSVSKYTQLYNDRGYSTIQTCGERISVHKTEADMTQLARLLDSTFESNKPDVIIHVLSNTGLMYYSAFCRAIEKDNDLKIWRTYIAGVIVDCAPADTGNVAGASMALSYVAGTWKLGRFIIGWLLFLIFSLLKLIRVWDCFHSNARYAGHLLSFAVHKYVPVMFLYSKKDAICPSAYIDTIVKQLKHDNDLVSSHCYDTGAHVDLLRTHLADYRDRVDTFLDTALDKSKNWITLDRKLMNAAMRKRAAAAGPDPEEMM